MKEEVFFILVLAAALVVVAQTCDEIGGNLSGIYQITSFDQNLGGPSREDTSYRAHCVALADYTTGQLLPAAGGGLLPTDKHLIGKLHCRYDAGLMQFAIMSDVPGGSVSLLGGKWYEGGWERCYDTEHRRCYHGLVTLVPLVGGSPTEWEGLYKCDDDDDSSSGLQVNRILLSRVADLEASECRSEAQVEECAVVGTEDTIRGQWRRLSSEDTLWDICVDRVDFTDFDLDYRSSTTPAGAYQAGLVHFSPTDEQLLVEHRIGSGCYRTCDSNEASGTAIATLLSTGNLLDAYTSSTWTRTSEEPGDCRLLEPLDVDEDFSCPAEHVEHHHHQSSSDDDSKTSRTDNSPSSSSPSTSNASRLATTTTTVTLLMLLVTH